MTVEINKEEMLTRFDEHWYLQTYQDVRQTGIPAREHFKRYGSLLGRKPCADWLVTPVMETIASEVNLPWLTINQLSVANSSLHEWQSEGEDPYFIVDLSQLPQIGKGWHQFNLNINCSGKQGLAKLYIDTGKGFNETETVCLPYKINGW